jgi:hypothetical protein
MSDDSVLMRSDIVVSDPKLQERLDNQLGETCSSPARGRVTSRERGNAMQAYSAELWPGPDQTRPSDPGVII